MSKSTLRVTVTVILAIDPDGWAAEYVMEDRTLAGIAADVKLHLVNEDARDALRETLAGKFGPVPTVDSVDISRPYRV